MRFFLIFSFIKIIITGRLLLIILLPICLLFNSHFLRVIFNCLISLHHFDSLLLPLLFYNSLINSFTCFINLQDKAILTVIFIIIIYNKVTIISVLFVFIHNWLIIAWHAFGMFMPSLIIASIWGWNWRSRFIIRSIGSRFVIRIFILFIVDLTLFITIYCLAASYLLTHYFISQKDCILLF